MKGSQKKTPQTLNRKKSFTSFQTLNLPFEIRFRSDMQVGLLGKLDVYVQSVLVQGTYAFRQKKRLFWRTYSSFSPFTHICNYDQHAAENDN